MKTTTKVVLVTLAYWLFASAMASWLYPVMISDACRRYAPMANAFASGDWYYAFHPRFGVLFSVLSGAVAFVTGLDGIYCTQPVAFLFLALAGLTVFFITRRLTGKDAMAWWAFALVLLAPDFFRYALDGLREPVKCLVFALVGYALVARRSWAMALALFAYVTVFTYGFAAGLVLLVLWCAWLLWKREGRTCILPTLGWFLGTVVVTVLTHAYTGHWLPAPQYIGMLGRWL